MNSIIALLISKALCYSRNQSVSEFGMSFTYNTHLEDWDIDVPDSGVPMLMGYITVLGDDQILNEGFNETLGEEEERVHPKWTTENSLRVCLSFFAD